MRAAELRRRQARAMTEEDLEAAVHALCRTLDVVYVHHRWSKGTTHGWPDDALVGTRLLLRELKRETGRVTVPQAAMLEDLRAAGVDVGVWRPSDLLSGRIAAEIQAISRRPHRRTP